MIVSEKDLEWLRTSTAFSRLVNPDLHCQAQSDRGRYRRGDRLSSWYNAFSLLLIVELKLEEDSPKSHHRKYCIQGSKCNPCVAAQSEILRRNFLQHTALMMWC
ncbi:unnamed protein product [Sphagnum troendelagicum]|uniref:Uncharacterized protein n=1 Tax=Sphagnum troendelagicum TaxID=128251 RepID=A0ABP0U0E4_9BRYO